LAFNIAQFFSLLNHILLLMILDKTGFNLRISSFFTNYLTDRRTQYVWNNFASSSFREDVGIEQDSVFSHILSALYIALIFHIFGKRTKNILYNIPIFTLSFMDNSLFISQEKSFEKLNVNIFCSYSIIFSLFEQFGLTIKPEIFYFSRVTKF